MTSTTGTDRPAGSQGFYHHNTSPEETRRLEAMARMRGDDVSFESLASLLDQDFGDKIVLDIGAGDSLSLGEMIENYGGHYVPTDIRADAVAKQQERFPLAMQANVVDLSQIGELGPRVDAVHARAVFGWLGENQRRTALAALAERTPNAGLSITDYDWSVADGPEEYMAAINTAMAVLRATGFRPEYGSYATEDLTKKIHEVLGEDSSVEIESQRDEVGRDIPLSEAMPVVELTASALADQLKKLGMRPFADQIQQRLDELNLFAQNHPGEPVSLPDFVTTRISVARATEGQEVSGARKTYHLLQAVRGPLDGRVNSLPVPASGLAKTEYQRLMARRVQAAAYYFDDIISADGIRHEDGTLIHTNDPLDLVDRSDYILATNMREVMASVRMIRPIDGDPESLPTVQRLKAHAPDSVDYLRSVGVFDDGARTLEVSGLARNPFAGDTTHVFDAIIALAYHTRKQGYDHAVMGLQERHVPVIVSMLGPEAIHPIPASDATHPVQLPCVDQDMNFVALYSDVNNMLDRVVAYTEARKGRLSRHINMQAKTALAAFDG